MIALYLIISTVMFFMALNLSLLGNYLSYHSETLYKRIEQASYDMEDNGIIIYCLANIVASGRGKNHRRQDDFPILMDAIVVSLLVAYGWGPYLIYSFAETLFKKAVNGYYSGFSKIFGSVAEGILEEKISGKKKEKKNEDGISNVFFTMGYEDDLAELVSICPSCNKKINSLPVRKLSNNKRKVVFDCEDCDFRFEFVESPHFSKTKRKRKTATTGTKKRKTSSAHSKNGSRRAVGV